MAALRSHGWPIGRRATAVVIALIALFSLLRIVSGSQPEPVESGFYTDKLVLVGDTDHYQLTETDATVIAEQSNRVQAAALSTRPRNLADCAAAGWSTIGAGRRAGVGGLCNPAVIGTGEQARVADWQARVDAAAARGGDAHLGTLASVSDRCIQAVGPGAALAAARPDGSLDNYLTFDQFAAADYRLDCPLTLVDSGDSEELITTLAARDDVTVIVAGVGHDLTLSVPDPKALQVIYRIGTTFPGLMTSPATRREGVVTITDLSRTLAGFQLDGDRLPAQAPMDGSLIEVFPQSMSPQLVTDKLRAVDNLSQVAVIGYVVGAAIGFLLGALIAVFVARRLWTPAKVALAALSVLLATLMLTGAFPWATEDQPAAALIFSLVFWLVALTVLTLAGSHLLKIGFPVVAAGLTLAAFTCDAALGAVMQPGSLLNSKPTAGARWYGFGNVTFGSYATAGLFVAGYLAHRFRQLGRRWMAATAVLVIGGLVIVCQGWPTMGADFGGVISLTPGVLFLALAVSGLKITWRRLVIIGVAAVLAVAAVSIVDWQRGPGRRSHLGDFVQRVIDGDAVGILLRKGLSSLGTLVSPIGVIGILCGVAIWWAVFRYARHAIDADRFGTYSSVALATLATAVLGTLLNDAGIAVFMTVTGPFAAYSAGLLIDPVRRLGPAGALRVARAHSNKP